MNLRVYCVPIDGGVIPYAFWQYVSMLTLLSWNNGAWPVAFRFASSPSNMPNVAPIGKAIMPKLTSDLIPMAANQEKRAAKSDQRIVDD